MNISLPFIVGVILIVVIAGYLRSFRDIALQYKKPDGKPEDAAEYLQKTVIPILKKMGINLTAYVKPDNKVQLTLFPELGEPMTVICPAKEVNVYPETAAFHTKAHDEIRRWIERRLVEALDTNVFHIDSLIFINDREDANNITIAI